jgi:polyhydroxybutyrate depolymerase
MTFRRSRFWSAGFISVGLALGACGSSEPAPGNGLPSAGGSAVLTPVAGQTGTTGGSGGTSEAASGGMLSGTTADGGRAAGDGTSGGGRAGTSGGTSAAGGQVSSGGQAVAGGATGASGTRGGRGSAGTATTGNVGGTAGGATTGGPSAGESAGADGGRTSPGCNSMNTTSPCGTKGTMCSLDVSGTARQYYVQLPKNYDSSTPYRLIFQFHPWGGTADQALTMYGLNSGIPDAIYVTPQGLDAGSNGPGWANTNGEDIAFTKAMLGDVQSKYCVDNSRIFSVGFSYGGMMSFALGCEMSNVFRAIAPMSGALYSDPSCPGTGPHVAMWGSHGTNDTVVPIDDGRAARDKILQQNHCGTTTTPVDPSPCVKYDGCDPGYDVTWCEWDGPHGIPSFGSSAITAFLKQF